MNQSPKRMEILAGQPNVEHRAQVWTTPPAHAWYRRWELAQECGGPVPTYFNFIAVLLNSYIQETFVSIFVYDIPVLICEVMLEVFFPSLPANYFYWNKTPAKTIYTKHDNLVYRISKLKKNFYFFSILPGLRCVWLNFLVSLLQYYLLIFPEIWCSCYFLWDELEA